MRARRWLYVLVLGALGPLGCLPTSDNEPAGFQVWESPQTNPIAITPDGSRLYVAHTTGGFVTVVDTYLLIASPQITVGDEPVSVTVRPDGNEVWVSNHLSDSVSVIDSNPASPTYHQVIDTVQWIDPTTLVTRFDEPANVVFASNSKAYVALSSRNQIAVVDVATRTVTGVLLVNGFDHLTAQEPRAMVVRNGRLYVAAFESDNQTELSACGLSGAPPQCTISPLALQQFVTDPNLPGVIKNIVVDPDVPDRDVFVFDTANDQLVDIVAGVGTLLYGLAVDSQDNVFVAQTEARNAENGLDGENLIDLDNRMFLNQVARLSCPGGNCGSPTRFELETALPGQPATGQQLAMPYGIAVSGDDSTLVVTAASSHRIATVDPNDGHVLGRLDVGYVPRGVVLRSGAEGEPERAYVLNSLDSSVTVVNLSNPEALALVAQVTIGIDPTPASVRAGRLAFHDASASSSGTFSCASCHPDGNTDQLLWRIGGACFFGACTQDDEPRSTMPVRGLRETLPLHWDGTVGDPFGGGNGAVGLAGSVDPSCSEGDPQTCFRDLVNGSLRGVMCDQASCPTGPSGLLGPLTDGERNDMASFLAAVAYPPARSRRPDDAITTTARNGFGDFFTDQNSTSNGASGTTDTCADSTAGCHQLPLGTVTNSSTLNGFEAPTMRGMTDRWVQFSNGITNTEEIASLAAVGVNFPPIVLPASQFPWNPSEGFKELTTFATAFLAFQPVYNTQAANIFQMFEEASTGFSGATSRQLTLNPANAGTSLTLSLMNVLETADQRGLVNLTVAGVRNGA
jgi:YVTN family beta-propeller protein